MPAAADPEIAAIFHRPFAEQVAFFRGKLGRLVPTATWRDLLRAEHDRAFMVAGAAKADLLADLAGAVDKAISEGESLDTFRRRFADIVQRHGWQGWTGSDTEAGRASSDRHDTLTDGQYLRTDSGIKSSDAEDLARGGCRCDADQRPGRRVQGRPRDVDEGLAGDCGRDGRRDMLAGLVQRDAFIRHDWPPYFVIQLDG